MLFKKSIIKSNNIIIGGNLNFFLVPYESWGLGARLEPLTDYFRINSEWTKLLDVELETLAPVWENQ